jgi:hypothetical protein
MVRAHCHSHFSEIPTFRAALASLKEWVVTIASAILDRPHKPAAAKLV